MVITIIGESCCDIFNYGNVTRLCPEAPVPVLTDIKEESNSGMAGNVRQNLLAHDSSININLMTQSKVIKKTRYIDDKVIVSDYNKGFLTEEVLIQIGKVSKLSIIDTKKTISKDLIDSFTFIKLNEHEYQRNRHISDKNKDKFIITLGMNGAKHNDIIFPSPSPKQTIDVSGAGDTFTAFFSLKYYETKNIAESITFANQMASIVVSKRGVATP